MRSLSFLLLALTSVFVLIASFGSTPAKSDDVGYLLYRTFLVFKSQPLNASEAINQGWEQYADCDDNYGIAYAYEQGGPTATNSPILYFTAGGQIAGIGERVWGNPPSSLIPDFWRPVEGADSTYDISINFRNSSMMCSGAYDYDNILGDQLTINNNFNIPLTMTDAEQNGWMMGACIPKMGIHHSYDLNSPGGSTWNVSSLVPVMPMYHPDTQEITAVLFWMNDLQYVEPLGDWEGPFIPSLFCKNWCSNSQCEFYDVDVFTTMHWMFKNPDLNSCTDAPCS